MKVPHKPDNCCHPDCFKCPYTDCMYSDMALAEYMETKRRDKENSECFAKRLERQKNRRYYTLHRKEILQKRKDTYDPEKNAESCKAYRESHLTERRIYERYYYQQNADRKRKMARERYHQKKQERMSSA